MKRKSVWHVILVTLFFSPSFVVVNAPEATLHSYTLLKIPKLLPASHYHFAPSLCLIKYDDITLLLRSLSNPKTPSKTAAACLPQLCPSSLADNMAPSRHKASARNMGFCSLPTLEFICFCTYALAMRHVRKRAVLPPHFIFVI